MVCNVGTNEVPVKQDWIDNVYRHIVLGQDQIRVGLFHAKADIKRKFEENVTWETVEHKVRQSFVETIERKKFSETVVVARGLCQGAKLRNQILQERNHPITNVNFIFIHIISIFNMLLILNLIGRGK